MKTHDLWLWLASHLPNKLVYWSTIVLLVHASTGKYSSTVVPELTAVDAIKRWETDKLRR